MKAAVAHYGKAPAWRTVRPPLTELAPQQERALLDALDIIGFRIPGL
jgi:4-hydroxy-tetrahydrodipicolinate synthase